MHSPLGHLPPDRAFPNSDPVWQQEAVAAMGALLTLHPAVSGDSGLQKPWVQGQLRGGPWGQSGSHLEEVFLRRPPGPTCPLLSF